MRIIGDRVLVKRVGETQSTEGFQKVEVLDSFLYKGEIVKTPDASYDVGQIILFDKYSRNTHEVDFEGQKMKLVALNDILAVL